MGDCNDHLLLLARQESSLLIGISSATRLLFLSNEFRKKYMKAFSLTKTHERHNYASYFIMEHKENTF